MYKWFWNCWSRRSKVALQLLNRWHYLIWWMFSWTSTCFLSLPSNLFTFMSKACTSQCSNNDGYLWAVHRQPSPPLGPPLDWKTTGYTPQPTRPITTWYITANLNFIMKATSHSQYSVNMFSLLFSTSMRCTSVTSPHFSCPSQNNFHKPCQIAATHTDSQVLVLKQFLHSKHTWFE